jgi:hypothetical protein
VFTNQTKQAEVANLCDAIIVDEYIELIERQHMPFDRDMTYWFQVSMNELDSGELRFLVAVLNLADVEGV